MRLTIPPRFHHSLLGGALGLWLYVLLVFLAPYDAAPLDIGWRAQLMLGYGVIFALSFQLAHMVEQRFLKMAPLSWWARQLWFLLIFVCLNFPLIFWYYKSPVVLGEYAFLEFVTQIYLTTLIVVVPLMLYGRKRIEQLSTKTSNQVILRGENKLDVLQLSLEELLYIETARNYVEVHYLQEGTAHKKLLRTTLKKVAVGHPELLRVHRSYLVNPSHITSWRDTKSVMINQREIPVSDSFRAQVITHFQDRP
ncbi:MAG: LytTR family DNA-binding domain-containing protein [Lewinella sp.]